MTMLKSLCGLILLLISISVATPVTAAEGGKVRVYVGTYTGPKSKGIYRMDLDLASGKLSQPELAGECVNPSFLAIAPNQKFLFAVNEVGKFNDQPNNGGVSAFAIDAKTGDLKLLNQQSSRGAAPCHITVDKTGKAALVANYSGGSFGSLPIKDDGSLDEMVSFLQHAKGSHGHSINLDAGNRYAVAADLGLNKLFVYKFAPDKQTLMANEPDGVTLPAGSGPRHFAFHPDGKHAYAINETALTMSVLDYDAAKGTLKETQNISTLPHERQKGYSCAEVVVHPSGKFLYGSNRGHNSIASFKIDPANGKITPTGHQSSGINTPRGFTVDPSGKWLLVGNQGGGSVVVFKINRQSGELEPTGNSAEIASPVCIRFLPISQ